MVPVAKLLDYMISPVPIRIEELKVDPSMLKIKGLIVSQFGHLPGRTLKAKGISTSSWAFTYIVRGSGYYQAGDRPVQPLSAGSLFWEWPGTTFRYGPGDDSDWDEYYINFNGTRVREWLDNRILKPECVYTVGVDSKWIRKIEAIGDLIESGVPDNADRAALLLESLIFDFSSTHEGLKAGATSHRKNEYILGILEDISNSLYQPWDERQLLERHHLSRSTLRRIVHQNTGYPLNEYVNRLKVSEAKKLLIGTPLQIKEISRLLGFDDNAYFSRIFKKYAGRTAASFRSDTKDGQQPRT